MERDSSSGEPEVAMLRPPRRRTVLLTGNCVSLHRPAGSFGRIAAITHGQWHDEGHGDKTGCPAPFGAAAALCEHLVRAGEVGPTGADFGPDELRGGAYVATAAGSVLALGTCPAFVSDLAAEVDAPCLVLSPVEIRLAFAEMKGARWLALAPEREHGRGWRPWLVAPDYNTALDFLTDTAGLCGSLRLTSAKALLDVTATSNTRMPMPRRGPPR